MASQYIKYPFFSLWGDPVELFADLPTPGREGEVRLVIDEGTLYWFDGADWVVLSGGGGGGSITIQTDLGTSPVGTNFTFTSTNSLDITGNSTTDEVLFEVKASYIRGLLSASGPLSYNSTTGDFTIAQSNTTTDGYLSSTDWNTFNNKVATSRQVNSGTGLSGGGDLSANRTLSVDITGLTEDTTPDSAADFVMTYDASASTLKKVKLSNLVSGGGASGSAIYGDEVDGDVSISADTTLGGLFCYKDVSLSGNIRVRASYPLVCKNLINVSGNNVIHNDGSASAGTTGGAQGTSSYNGMGAGGGGGAGTNTGTPTAATSLTNSLGGAGGNGGSGDNNGTPTTGGSGGGAANPTAAIGGKNSARLSAQTYRFVVPSSATAIVAITGGAGGGGGGIRGTGQTSRGGGGGGGVCWIKARTVSITAGTLAFEARGGNGQTGLGSAPNYEGGSGAGGGGVVVAISTTNLSTLSGLSTSVAGGIGGAPAGGAATAGADGSPGTVILLRDGE